MPQTYNGHHCWTCWNVALWLANEEPLYRRAMDLLAHGTVASAARILRSELPARTPDGARYTLTAIRSALADFQE